MKYTNYKHITTDFKYPDSHLNILGKELILQTR